MKIQSFTMVLRWLWIGTTASGYVAYVSQDTGCATTITNNTLLHGESIVQGTSLIRLVKKLILSSIVRVDFCPLYLSNRYKKHIGWIGMFLHMPIDSLTLSFAYYVVLLQVLED
jgi:hypothetical protein